MKLYNISKINNINISSLFSQVQTNTNDISELKTFENGINTTIDERVKTDLTTTYSNDDYESMTGLKNWVESKGSDSLTMEEIEDNLTYNGDIEQAKNFNIEVDIENEEPLIFDTRTDKLNLNNVYTTFTTFVKKFFISFYKHNNKICGFCLLNMPVFGSSSGLKDNAGNAMSAYEVFSLNNTNSANASLKMFDESNNEIQPEMTFIHKNNRWNYMNVLFNEYYSDTIIKAFFGDNVSVDDIQCTKLNDYLRTSDDRFIDTTNPHPTYNIPYSNPFLFNQTKSFLTNYFTNDDFESMAGLKNWVESKVASLSSINTRLSLLTRALSSIIYGTIDPNSYSVYINVWGSSGTYGGYKKFERSTDSYESGHNVGFSQYGSGCIYVSFVKDVTSNSNWCCFYHGGITTAPLPSLIDTQGIEHSVWWYAYNRINSGWADYPIHMFFKVQPESTEEIEFVSKTQHYTSTAFWSVKFPAIRPGGDEIWLKEMFYPNYDPIISKISLDETKLEFTEYSRPFE